MHLSERVVRLAARGDGVTESGMFVPMVAPGDLVTPDGEVTAGPHRAVPPCRHFPECGGCQLQHVDDAAYCEFLRDRVASALAAQQLPVPDILAPHISPPRSRRRATLKAEKKIGRTTVGFNAEKSHRIVDMRECHILRPELFALVEPVRTLLHELFAARDSARIQMTLADQGVDLTIEGFHRHGLASAERLAAFSDAHRLARLAVDDGGGPETRWEPEPATITLSGVLVPLPHGAFLQATEEGEAALVASVRDAVGPARIVADLFAGLGTFALSLQGKILAAEGARDAAAALNAAAKRAGRAVFVDHRDLFRRPLTAADLGRFEAIVLDPPRAGAKEQVAEIARSAVPGVAYVSCNPNTFARDAKALCEGGYRLDWVKPVGQFRWSTHVELAAAFSR
ncbi:MAG TPA: class I SAM-dependent RNA methyltransferase [Allosphingosinicella sp.]|nr:class I SAM-dependent RNA methyltransferase [Allosphingosinicella sp.]HYG30989.1 class I SAM-dependent RNA methyltransferase [Allosphingosinicella sp.]